MVADSAGGSSGHSERLRGTMNLELGQPVTWMHGKHRPIRLTGHLTGYSGDVALVEVSGNTYEVQPNELKPARVCLTCGAEIHSLPSRRQRYCSTECRYEDVHADHEDWVFQAIIDFKLKNDGWSPSIPMIAKATGLAIVTVNRTIRRLVEAGRIKIVGNGRYQGFIVTGGRWVYEPPTDEH